MRSVKDMTVADIVAVGSAWDARLACIRPRNVLELGTGQGAGGACIMVALAPDAIFTTINYVDGHVFGEQLRPWYTDPRLHRIDADTIAPSTVYMVPDGVDLLFIDTTHEAWHAAAELCLWQCRLCDGAIVIVDDLDQQDMGVFWESIPYEKVRDSAAVSQGMFRYDASKRYEAEFSRPDHTTYHGER